MGGVSASYKNLGADDRAYAYGVRELWIVNVGDLKFQEYPLNYFMEMAYDFDTWGSAHPESPKAYTEKWVQQQFGPETSPEERKQHKKCGGGI